MSEGSIAINRFGIGARPEQEPPGSPRRWLIDQLARYEPKPTPIAAAASSATVATALAEYLRDQRLARQGSGRVPDAVPAPMMDGSLPQGGAPQPLPVDQSATKPPRTDAQREARRFIGREAREHYAGAVAARAAAAFTTDAPFVERLIWFWANHFAVSIDKLAVVGLAGTLEFEAIRPHVLGRFGDMLTAVERHPAMLLYLDQAVSVGPDSPIGERAAARRFGPQRKVGLNENLAREILELHTLGVRTGYTQADVTEFARSLTGWTVAGIGGGPLARQLETFGKPGEFVFAEPIHQPGSRMIMGKRYGQPGVKQAQAVLDDLAVHPATAHHVATKLARHFGGDTPPPAMVARLEAAFLKSGGDLPTVYAAIVNSPEAWVAASPKFKTPWEWSVSAYRALGAREAQPAVIVGLLNQLGQPVWKPGQPVGYDDIGASWAGPDAVLRRVEAAERFAGRAPASIDARALAPRLFPAALSPATDDALRRAESPAQALALLLVAPEMMRR